MKKMFVRYGIVCLEKHKNVSGLALILSGVEQPHFLKKTIDFFRKVVKHNIILYLTFFDEKGCNVLYKTLYFN